MKSAFVTPRAWPIARCTIKRPAFMVAIVCSAVAGAISAMVPTALHGDQHGPGVLGGLGYGLLGAALLAVAALPVLVVALCLGDDEMGLADELLLAGYTDERRRWAQLIGAVGTVLCLAPLGMLGGLACALGDSIRQEGYVLGHIPSQYPALGGLVFATYTGLLAWGIAARLHSRSAAAAVIALGSIALFVILPLKLTLRVSLLTELHPLAPLWATVYTEHSVYRIDMSPGGRLGVGLAWVFLASLSAAPWTRIDVSRSSRGHKPR